MAVDPLTASLISTGVGTAVNALFGGGPDFGSLRDEINRMFDQRINAATSRTSNAIRRRSQGAGIGGSTAINTLIEDSISQLTSALENERAAALAQIDSREISFQERNPGGRFGQALQSGIGLGTSVFGATGGFDNLVNNPAIGGGGGTSPADFDPFFNDSLPNFDSVIQGDAEFLQGGDLFA
jgi:hypothetical protein